MRTLHSERYRVDAADVLLRTVELVNVSRPSRSGDEPTTVVDVLRRHGERMEPPITERELERFAAVLDELGAVFELTDVDEAASALNTLLERYCAPPRLVQHEGWPWHLHVDRGDDEAWHRWVGASGSFALASRLAGRSTVPWGVCGAAGCKQVFVHDDRGAPRRHCSTTCGTRTRVARHRERRVRPG
ncbi:MAG: CGNR zinc finger domain-containing protein [Acidimicrobiia bacterium]